MMGFLNPYPGMAIQIYKGGSEHETVDVNFWNFDFRFIDSSLSLLGPAWSRDGWRIHEDGDQGSSC
jgi:hypothetical protein